MDRCQVNECNRLITTFRIENAMVSSGIQRAVGSFLFFVGGGVIVLFSMLGIPSFWYWPCFLALPIVGIAWAWRPGVAAALSVGPLIGVAALLQHAPEMWPFSRIWVFGVFAGLVAALLLVIKALHGFSAWRLPVVISLLVVTLAFSIDRLFTNKVVVRSYQMQMALDGNTPWGELAPESSQGAPPMVVYRRVGDSYCYDTFESEELRKQLAPRERQTVIVEYNVFRDFGKDEGYNVRSVDGVLLSDGHRLVRGYWRSGGEILANSGVSARSSNTCR